MSFQRGVHTVLNLCTACENRLCCVKRGTNIPSHDVAILHTLRSSQVRVLQRLRILHFSSNDYAHPQKYENNGGRSEADGRSYL
jgi:predicted nucleic acid binding AN1-type Zn finger protein